MATQQSEPPITPPTGPEVNVSSLGKHAPASMPDSILKKAQAMAGETPKPEPTPEAKSAPEAKPEPKKAAPEPAKEQPKETPKAIEKPDPEKKESGPKELREAYERQRKKTEELELSLTSTAKEKADALAKQAELAQKLASYEERITKEFQPALQELESTRKALTEREEALRIRDYTATTEWHEKYEKPLADINTEVEQLMSELVVNQDGVDRKATIQDFQEVLNAPNHTLAARMAKTIFGEEVYQSVLNYRMRLQSQMRSRKEALDRAAIESSEYMKRQQSAVVQAQEMLRQKLQAEESAIFSSEPDLFKAPDDDSDWRNALDSGRKLVDEVASIGPNDPPERVAKVAARARAEIIASQVMRTRLAKANKELAELRDQLKQYQSTEPEVKGRETPEAIRGQGSWKDKLMQSAQRLATS